MSKKTQVKSENKTKKVLSIVAWILVAVIVLGVVGVYSFVNSGTVERNTVAAKSENYTVTSAMMNYLYNNLYQNYMGQYSQYGSVQGLTPDASKPLDQQDHYSGQTWHAYFLEQAQHQLEEALVLAEAAKAAGYKLSDEDMADIDETMETLKSTAKLSGVSVNVYLSSAYGNSVNEKVVRSCMEILKIAENYQLELVDTYSYTAEDWDKYFEENEESFLKYDYLTYTFEVAKKTDDKKEDDKKEETTASAAAKAADTTTDKKDDKKEPAIEATYAEELAATADADSFKAYVKNYLETVKYADMTEEELEEDEIDIEALVEDTLVEAAAVDKDSKDEFTKWACDAARAPYETKVIESSDKTKYMVYMILPAAEDDLDGEDYEIMYRETYLLKDFRYIPVAMDSTNKNTTTAMQNARKDAEKLLEEYKKNATVENFAELANKQETGNGEGNLVENGEKGVINDDASEWLFSADRKSGDATIIEVEGQGYYVLCYVGDGDQCWQFDADTALKSDKYTEDYEGFAEAHAVTFYKKGVGLVKAIG